jgi:superfamily I DNA/RNA helicase
MGWYLPFWRLSQTQVAIIEDITRHIDSRNHFICGFAGSGKSVLLTHVLERLIADRPHSTFAFLSFTHALVGMAREALAGSGLRDSDARRIKFSTVHSFVFSRENADYVFVDETQDLKAEMLYKIRSKASHVVLAGDYEQTIYAEAATHDKMVQVFDPKVHELRQVFRLTPSLKRIAVAISPSASKVVEAEPANSVDAQIRDAEFECFEDEVAWVVNEARMRARAGSPSAVLFHHHSDLRHFYETVFRTNAISLPTEHPRNPGERYINMNEKMAAAGMPVSYYGNQVGTLKHGERGPHVYFMTIHSSKGLDFRNVFLPKLNRERVRGSAPLEPFQIKVCYVGVTRSFENLFLTHLSGPMEPPFDKLPRDDVAGPFFPARPATATAAEDIFS